ncbi:MAG: FAD-dependent oxidoreductase [Candidatus Sericytochromatia bacterium]|nr:FAD-dependent oxidoreductase [Candidatus Sericytochromatia bacterium]
MTTLPAGVPVTAGSKVHTANRAMITLPLGVLKKGAITFTPALPARRLAAIQHLGMGGLDKVYLR